MQEKQSAEFAGKLDAFMLGMEDDLMNFKDVEYKGCILKEKEIIDLFISNSWISRFFPEWKQ